MHVYRKGEGAPFTLDSALPLYIQAVVHNKYGTTENARPDIARLVSVFE